MDETTNSLIGGHPEVVRNGFGVLEADFWPARFRRSISGLPVTRPGSGEASLWTGIVT